MRILLVQLPVQSSDFSYANEYIPLACGYLCAFLMNHSPQCSCQILDYQISAYGSDTIIVNSILEQDPDVIGFSCYVWNVERTLYIINRLRNEGYNGTIIIGGPEVTTDNKWLLSNSLIDLYIIGEGEKGFADCITKLKKSSFAPGTVIKPQNVTNLNKIPSPYLSGIITPSNVGTLLLEGARGCRYRCSYCYYHKSTPGVRSFDIKWVSEHIVWGVEQGVKEVTFVDPSFLARRDIEDFLKTLSFINREKKVELYAEINAEHCNKKLAELLAKAGFVQVEVGLQSSNSQALKNVRRNCDLEKLTEGIKLLRDQGIRVTLDLIVALPGDNLESVMESVDFAVRNELYDELNLYPLSILPGTELRKNAHKMGLKHMQNPPYYVTQTDNMNAEDIKKAFQFAEEISGFDFFPPEIPFLSNKVSGYTSYIELPEASTLKHIRSRPIANALSIKINRAIWTKEIPTLKRHLQVIIEENPFTYVNWIIPFEIVEQTPRGLKKLQELYVHNRDHPSDREFFSTRSPINSVQVFVIMEDKMWIWIPQEPWGGEFRLIPETADPSEIEMLENKACKALSLWTNRPTPLYRITEVIS